MNRPEPIELENNLGPDAVTGEINRVPWKAYDVDEMDLYIAEKDAEIAELKKKLMPCLNGDCILTCEVVEKYGKENAELKEFAEDACLERDDNQTAIDELLKEIESLKASHYAESVDSGMRERRLRRELWLTRAMRAHREKSWSGYVEYVHFHENSFYEFDGDVIVRRDNRNNDSFREWNRRWVSVERKCRAKAEEYK